MYSGMAAIAAMRSSANAVLAEGRLKLVVISGGDRAAVLYESNLLAVVRGNRLIKLRAKHVVVATGAHERFSVFEDNDIPGVLPASGLQRLIHLYGTRPGKTVAIVTDCDAGLGVARTLIEAGIGISVYADARFTATVHLAEPQLELLKGRGTVVLSGYRIKRVLGQEEGEGGGAGPDRRGRSDLAEASVGEKVAVRLLHLPRRKLLEAGHASHSLAGGVEEAVFDEEIGDFVVAEGAKLGVPRLRGRHTVSTTSPCFAHRCSRGGGRGG